MTRVQRGEVSGSWKDGSTSCKRATGYEFLAGFVIGIALVGLVPAPAFAVDTAAPSWGLWEFTATRHTVVFPRRNYKGLVMSDGSRQWRLAIYWIDPPISVEETDDLACSDMIYRDGVLHCWVQDSFTGRNRFQLGRADADARNQASAAHVVAPILQSIFAAVQSIRETPREGESPSEMARFFRESQPRDEYERQTVPAEGGPDAGTNDSGLAADTWLKTPPLGRVYRKRSVPNGSTVWRSARALTLDPVVTVTVQPLRVLEAQEQAVALDPHTLGQWTVVPEPYRQYWAFQDRYIALGRSPDAQTTARALHAEIEAYLGRPLPADLELPLCKLRFRVALKMNCQEVLSRELGQYFRTLAGSTPVTLRERILELGQAAAQISRNEPEHRTRALVYPLLQEMVEAAVFAKAGFLEGLMSEMQMRRWFRYGQWVVEVLREEKGVESGVLDGYYQRLETGYLSEHVADADPNTLTASMREFLGYAHRAPPAGRLSLADLRLVLQEGLAGRFSAPANGKEQFVTQVLATIRRIAGDGLFRGDPAALRTSLTRFDRIYHPSQVSDSQMQTLLATFLCLSFYDTSTPADHEALLRQLDEVIRLLKQEIAGILAEQKLTAVVTRDEVNRLFDGLGEEVRLYTGDVLWPMFKYPMTENEQTRLVNKLKIGLGQLRQLAERSAAELDAGGNPRSARVRLGSQISGLANELPYRVVCLRRPRYAGVSCGYGGGVGLHVGMKGPFYEQADQAQGVFETMKCFYLGHRLAGFVPGRPAPGALVAPPSSEENEEERKLP